MAWNWSQRKSNTNIQRKPVTKGDGENTPEVHALAERYIKLGNTRQKA